MPTPNTTSTALPPSVLTKSQTKEFRKSWTEDGDRMLLVATVRHDDRCGNGHNSFAITGVIYRNGREECCGYLHDEISLRLPQLAPLIKWHLVSTDGPMHYIANTMYHASTKDHNGLEAGEERQIRRGGKTPCWIAAVALGDGSYRALSSASTIESDERPEPDGDLQYIPWCRVGKGKEADLEAARSCAVWPDATLDQLQDKDALLARLPALMEGFKAAVESLGMVY